MAQQLPAYPDQPWFQPEPVPFRRLTITPASGACGAEISGVDLAKLDAQTVAEIKQALLHFGVVFFRKQGHLTDRQYHDFAENFGEVSEYPMLSGVSKEFPNITVISKMEAETINFGGGWHSDTTYLTIPPKYTMLLARKVPPSGGDTLFSNQYLAYETLSSGLKAVVNKLKVKTTNLTPGAIISRSHRVASSGTTTSIQSEELKACHPLVRQHPETGRRALFTNGGHTVGIDGWKNEEALALLRYLWDHMVRPEYTCRWRWEEGSLALWDNRAVLHNAVNDYHGHVRVMHRITIKGDVPRHECSEAPPYKPSKSAGGLLNLKL
ncbi:taurine dioxygenase-like protein [Hyaloraphidium curvatum]|nr:taurine dioxygenase-like protein [Hyaloraphidium curvatum]